MTHILSLILLTFVMLSSGCMTSTRVADSRDPEIQVTSAGEILFEDKTITQAEILSVFKERQIKRDQTVFILVPSEPSERNPVLMKSIVTTLKRAGYGRTVFTTHRKAVSNLKKE
jgi:biopolymer transport protein ExbD